MYMYVLNHQVASLEKELQELESYKPDKKSHNAIQVISVIQPDVYCADMLGQIYALGTHTASLCGYRI